MSLAVDKLPTISHLARNGGVEAFALVWLFGVLWVKHQACSKHVVKQ
jgi:hypothetical protein